MNYISGIFALFLCLGVIIYFIVPKKLQIYVLLLLNLVFYTYMDWRFLLFLAATIISTYMIARLWKKIPNNRGRYLAAVVALNITVLVFMKFYGYLANIFHMPQLRLIVPLGISFYTLQAVSYCIDVCKGKLEAETNFFRYAAYLSYFPTIVQGPIMRYKDMKEQLAAYHKFDYERITSGLQLSLYGLFKKLVVADRAAMIVNDVFANYTQYSKMWILLGVMLYSIQIYTDFSGCVDVCRGVSRVFGIEIMNNFKNPYFATSVKDFWRRWHISLSSWLRDYVYIPLGGNRKGKLRRYINLMLTFLVSGLWHGVGIHYLVWGGLQGFYQIVGEVLLPAKKRVIEKLDIRTGVYSYQLLQRIITFGLISFSWIFFRANGTRDALHILNAICTNQWVGAFSEQTAVGVKDFVLLLMSVFVVLRISILQQKFSVRKKLNEQNIWFRWLIYFAAIFSILIFGIYGSGYNSATFIYMQF